MTVQQLQRSLSPNVWADLVRSNKVGAVLAAYNQHHDCRGRSRLEICTPTNGKPRH